MMKDIKVTTYRGFSNVSGEINLSTLMGNIRTGMYLPIVRKIEEQVQLGDIAKADRIKRQLPFFTLTANYGELRRPYSLMHYNDVITVDVDHVPTERLDAVRCNLQSDSDVLALFLTPKRHGFKIFLYLRSDYALRLRRQTFSVPSLHVSALEKYHALMYEAARQHVESLIALPVDASGKDISRGFFASYDPNAYFNTHLLKEMEEIATELVRDKEANDGAIRRRAVEECEKDERKWKQEKAAPGRTQTAVGGSKSSVSVAPWEEMDYKKALATTRRSENFATGNRDNFLFVLGNRCYRKGLNEEVAVALVERDFHQEDMDVSIAIRNAYRYVDKTREAQKESEKPSVARVIDFLGEHYDIRRNTVLDRLELRERSIAGEAPAASGGAADAFFRPLRAKDINSIYLNLLTSGVSVSLNSLKAVVDSDYVSDFNPFEEYLLNLPPWDGKTDYIGSLADTVQTEDQPFWRESFRRWLVGSVACALHDKTVNQLMLILYGGQGKGKSTWISRLLPPQWKEYYHNGMLNPENKDDLLHLSTRYLVNLDEFQGVKPSELPALKRMVTLENITLRKVYDAQACSFVRRASFIASTNRRQCLQDIEGNRRFLPSSVLTVDYATPVDHASVYSQALSLLRSGYRYWYEGSEIDRLNNRNELHRQKDPVEENLFVYYRQPQPQDLCVKWMPASAILTRLTIYGKVQVNRQTLQELVQALVKYGFNSRTNQHGGTEYEVVEYQVDEVERNFKKGEEKPL